MNQSHSFSEAKIMKCLIPTLVATLIATMAQAQTPVLLRTFNNPAPEAGGFFGRGMAVDTASIHY